MRDRIQNYVFTPGVGGSGTIKVQGYVETADILVITNVTTNTIIYQFSDPNKGATVSYNPATDADYPQSQNGVTTITLDYNTSLMTNTDKLQIYVETREVTVRPWHFGTDSIERMRMAQPQSLIDADFEYGLQNTKWQSLAYNANMPAIYEQPGADMTLNTQGYATVISSTSTIADASDTTFSIANQGTPRWVQDDYALLINQTNVVPASGYITSNVSGSQQRTIEFGGNTAAFSSGDLIAIFKVEPESSECNVATSISSTGTTTLVIQGANTITNGDFIQVETNTADIFELMAVTSGGGTGTLTVVRQRNNSNATGVNINSGKLVRELANVEIANVFSITSSTSMIINRGWYNTTPLDFVTEGSQIQKLNTGDGALGNLEIVKLTTVGTTVGNAIVVSRAAAGSTAKTSSALSGSLLVRMAGIFQAGSPIADGVSGFANVAQIGVNTTAHSISTGGYLSTQNHRHPDSEGLYFLSTSDTNNLFYYPKKSSGLPLGYPLNQFDTVIRKATAYTGAPIPVSSITSDGLTPSTLTIVTPYAHGLAPGTPLLISLTSGSNLAWGSGAFPILSVPTLTSFTVQAKNGASVGGSLAGDIIIKPNSYFIHRPFDGGIAMTNGSPHHGATAARQTKKYFRYQSGKGLFFTSGTLFCPTYDITGMSADGTTANSNITVQTEQNHQLQIGAIVRISGISTTGYAGRTYRVTNIFSDRSFEIEAQTTLGSTVPVFAPQPRVNVVGFYGGAVRAGMFDEQNGCFWEYDGEKLNVVKRSATYQCAGLASVQSNSNLVTGDGTCKFSDQLKIGDSIVIRGMTHTVTSIADQNTMTVIPEYRGVSNETRVKITLVQEQRIPQNQFNIDVMDGTGPSGYVIDPAKMQMIMIQYTWYGAGFIEYGVRGPNGKMILAHRIKNNNVNDEAYMRSGNLPARYEAASTGALTKLFANIGSGDTYFYVNDGTFLPGNVTVEYPVYLSVENEIIKYTGITKNMSGNGNTVANITGVTRAASLTQWIEGASRTFTQGSAVSHTKDAGVYVLGCTAAPTLTHWGSAVIMDGGFDDDKGFSFTFNRQNVTLPTAEGQRTTLFLMRLAPSVSNTIIGPLGTRDLINRAELNLERLIVNITGGRYLIEGILNPTNLNLHTTTFVNLNTVPYGNQPSFTQFSTNIQFSGTTVGSILPGGLAFTGTRASRGPLRQTSAGGSYTFSGTAPSTYSRVTYSNLNTTTVSGGGSGATVTIVRNNVVSALWSARVESITIVNPGSGYVAGNQIKVAGNLIGGTTPTNDLTITLNTVGRDALFANNIVLTTTTGSGSGANVSIRVEQELTTASTTYQASQISYAVNAVGDSYAPGDNLTILGNVFGANSTTTTNDMTLSVQSIAGSVSGGERLFAIPISGSGELNLQNIKNLGTSAVPGSGVYPDGPEVLAITITCISAQTTLQYGDVQLSFNESQA